MKNAPPPKGISRSPNFWLSNLAEIYKKDTAFVLNFMKISIQIISSIYYGNVLKGNFESNASQKGNV